jgi:hypothetical protein
VTDVDDADSAAAPLATAGAHPGRGRPPGVALRALLGGHLPDDEPTFGDRPIHVLLTCSLLGGSQIPL